MTASPFKFLDPYARSDKAVFFGRDAEVEELYRLVFQTNLVLVYGTSGTGKTSLIQCGLANRFQPSDWFELFVRREENINAALDRAIRARAETDIAAGASVVEAVQSLYLDHLRPIYLIFDQFEELFIMGSAEEQDAFFDTVAALLAAKVSAKIVISMREEYLAQLHRFEKIVPTLFNKRLRVETMSMANVEAVIVGTTAANGVALENGAATAQAIIANLDDTRVGVQLAYLQVYLDKLYRLATEPGDDRPVTFTEADVAAAGTLGDIMADFLGEQTAAIQHRLAASHPGIEAAAAQHILEAFVTSEATKQPMTRAELTLRLPALDPVLDNALTAFQAARIVRIGDGRIELAHDSLARHIAARRSDERKLYAQVEKIVRDRLAAYPQTKSYMNREELAVVNRSRVELELTEQEARFVDKSASKARWRRIGLVAVLSVTGAVLLVTTVASVVAVNETTGMMARYGRDLDDLTFETYTGLQPFSGEEINEIRMKLLTRSAIINREAQRTLDFDGAAPDSYWDSLLTADQNWEASNLSMMASNAAEDAGNPDEAADHLTAASLHRTAAAETYQMLAEQQRNRLQIAEDDLDARVRLRNLLWRLDSVTEDETQRRLILQELLAISLEDSGSDFVDFSDNKIELCELLTAAGGTSPACDAASAAQ